MKTSSGVKPALSGHKEKRKMNNTMKFDEVQIKNILDSLSQNQKITNRFGR